LDPKLTQIAKDYFYFKNDDSISVINQDGRMFLNANTKTYDAIYMDAYSDFTFPWHLITKESVERLSESLVKDGVFIINVISSIDGETGMTFRAIHHTLNSVFPNVYVFPVTVPDNGNAIQNLVLVAVKEDNNTSITNDTGEYTQYISNYWMEDISDDVPIITDDYAPLEYYYFIMSKAVLSSVRKS